MPEPPPYWARIRIDARVLLFTFLVSMLSAIISGLLPALRVSRVNRPGSLVIGSRSGDASPDQRRLQGSLVAAQVAVSLGLLVSATLLALSSRSLLAADVGFDPRPLFSFRVYLAGASYDRPEARAQVLCTLLARLAAAPGVSAAAATGAIPSDDGGGGVRLVPPRATGAPGEEIGAQHVPVTPGLFDTLGLRLLEGRTFTATETVQPDSDVVIVNRHLAAQFWPGESAIGRQLQVAQASGIIGYRVVGVVPDVVYEELGEETPQSQLTVYVPYAVSPSRTMAVLLRTPGDPAALAGPARRLVREANSDFASYDAMTMWDRRLMTSWGERLEGRTFAAFAAAALLLACLGIYGLTAYTVAQRTREIGVRLAIGAAGADILRLLLGRGLKLALIGGIAGVPLAIAGARMVQDDLFRVSPWTPAVWIVLPTVLVSSVALASFIPARRATLIDPATALRQD
jgi:putative ABC transport system permease protein